MAARKKKKETIKVSSLEESVAPEEERVSQVVEVVEETDKSEAIETIKKDAQEIEDVAPIAEKEEKQKEVVEELFQKDSSQVGAEITSVKNGSSKNFFIWAAIVVGVAVLVGGGLVLASNGGFALPFMAKPTPTPAPEPTPTPTPATLLDRKDLTIQVLNGGGAVGAASKMKSFLEEKGYTVSSIGNAGEYSFEKTEILVKKDKEAYISLLEKDLQGQYSIGTSAATLSAGSSYDARVTVGKE